MEVKRFCIVPYKILFAGFRRSAITGAGAVAAKKVIAFRRNRGAILQAGRQHEFTAEILGAGFGPIGAMPFNGAIMYAVGIGERERGTPAALAYTAANLAPVGAINAQKRFHDRCLSHMV